MNIVSRELKKINETM